MSDGTDVSQWLALASQRAHHSKNVWLVHGVNCSKIRLAHIQPMGIMTSLVHSCQKFPSESLGLPVSGTPVPRADEQTFDLAPSLRGGDLYSRNPRKKNVTVNLDVPACWLCYDNASAWLLGRCWRAHLRCRRQLSNSKRVP